MANNNDFKFVCVYQLYSEEEDCEKYDIFFGGARKWQTNSGNDNTNSYK